MSELSSNATNEDDPTTDRDVDGNEGNEHMYTEDVGKYIEEHGVSGIEEFWEKKLEKWRDVVINIAVTGGFGTGKSSFINAIRGLKDYDEGAAKTGSTETTIQPTKYPHPRNNKIIFWDMPGIGTPNYPTETYSEGVHLEKYDIFLILSVTRFTENDLKLARMVTSIKKTFFFVRTKIDLDVMNEKLDKPTTFNEDELLQNVKKDCLLNLKEFPSEDEDVFLISKRKTAQWDFPRLAQAILDALPIHQRESLTFTLNLLTIRSKEILKRKVKVLRGRIFMVAVASGFGALIPVPKLYTEIYAALLTNELNFYKRELGLPDENADVFIHLSRKVQETVRKFSSIGTKQVPELAAGYGVSFVTGKFNRYIPFIGPFFEGSTSFTSAYSFLHLCLNDMETTALEFLEGLNTKLADNLPPN